MENNIITAIENIRDPGKRRPSHENIWKSKLCVLKLQNVQTYVYKNYKLCVLKLQKRNPNYVYKNYEETIAKLEKEGYIERRLGKDSYFILKEYCNRESNREGSTSNLISDTQVEAPIISDTPVEAPIIRDTPVETSITSDTPVEAPIITDTPVETPITSDTPVEATIITDTPVEAPIISDYVIDSTQDIQTSLEDLENFIDTMAETYVSNPDKVQHEIHLINRKHPVEAPASRMDSLEKELEFLKKEVQDKNKMIMEFLSLLKNLCSVNHKVQNFSCKCHRINSNEENHNCNKQSLAESLDEHSNCSNDSFETSSSQKVNLLYEKSDQHNAKLPPIWIMDESINQENRNVSENFKEQLTTVRKEMHNKWKKKNGDDGKTDKPKEDSNTVKKWEKGTTLIVGDSMLRGINEKKLSSSKTKNRNRKLNAKVRVFPGATVDNFYHYIMSLLSKSTSNIILHVGTNNARNETSRTILGKLLSLKLLIENELPSAKVIISNIITRSDDGKVIINSVTI